MRKDEFYERASITAISSFVLYEASININGTKYSSEGSSSDEAKDNLWEYIVSDLGIL